MNCDIFYCLEIDCYRNLINTRDVCRIELQRFRCFTAKKVYLGNDNHYILHFSKGFAKTISIKNVLTNESAGTKLD